MAKKRTKVIIAGAGGRMGKTILGLAHRDPGIEIVGAFEHSNHSAVGRDVGELIGVEPINIPVHPDLHECVRSGGIVIDFTHPDAVEQNLDVAATAKCAMVIGTTGLTNAFLKRLNTVANKIGIVQAPNMSVGVNLLYQLVSLVGKSLDSRYDIEIVEEHHRHKKDAPSGTALELARLVAKAREVSLERNAVYGRKGVAAARKKGSIGIHAIRGGDTIGIHNVSFISEGERLELVHKASSREAFGHGALVAAKFIAKKNHGLYNMQQVLGLDG
jgi:4-hydroxy-tetrahydrodipicolinate reductase